MRHGIRNRKFNRSSSARIAMMKNLAISLFRYGQITTTISKAKDLRPFAEKMITKAKKGTLHSRRVIASKLFNNDEISEKLCSEIAPCSAHRDGGYIRIVRSHRRESDDSDMSIVQIIDYWNKLQDEKEKS